ncbi:unnamed protein product [Caenorhabditis auriculariae]|uniref:LisH domain-containing protein n=1 Tax=Caenorhabditis auriculariae TaxID=2777116 RepID=A0A8S1GNN3_9PELO|nr:unnamed protein product [Caenorhabditis auriculariae]
MKEETVNLADEIRQKPEFGPVRECIRHAIRSILVKGKPKIKEPLSPKDQALHSLVALWLEQNGYKLAHVVMKSEMQEDYANEEYLRVALASRDAEKRPVDSLFDGVEFQHGIAKPTTPAQISRPFDAVLNRINDLTERRERMRDEMRRSALDRAVAEDRRRDIASKIARKNEEKDSATSETHSDNATPSSSSSSSASSSSSSSSTVFSDEDEETSKGSPKENPKSELQTTSSTLYKDYIISRKADPPQVKPTGSSLPSIFKSAKVEQKPEMSSILEDLIQDPASAPKHENTDSDEENNLKNREKQKEQELDNELNEVSSVDELEEMDPADLLSSGASSLSF